MTGVLPDSQIRGLIASGALAADPAITDAQVQPASLDLRLGTDGLPGPRLVPGGAWSRGRRAASPNSRCTGST